MISDREYLLSLELIGIKLGLEQIRALVSILGHPERAYPSIIVAGTNGKGSVTAMIERALRAAGRRTGRYTSPHLVDLEERFAIDGRPISRGQFDIVARRVREAARLLASPPSFFEATTALATYVGGRSMDNDRVTQLGADFLESQVVAAITTVGLKFAVNRTRPDGEARSFPSGHAAGTFAMATVAQRHFGWKVAVPAYGAAVLISGARLHANSHYATDVIAGATIGILAGRAATFELAGSRVSVSPVMVPGGAAVSVEVGPRK